MVQECESGQVEQDATEIAKIVNAEGLRELTITIKRPNPDDDSDDEEAAIEKELLEQNAREEVMTLKARSGKKGLKANKRTKALANVAKSNGRVEARIRTHGATRVVSSVNKPLKKQVIYDSKETYAAEAFENEAMNMANDLKR